VLDNTVRDKDTDHFGIYFKSGFMNLLNTSENMVLALYHSIFYLLICNVSLDTSRIISFILSLIPLIQFFQPNIAYSTARILSSFVLVIVVQMLYFFFFT
jgi:hypothetical protein